MPLQFSESERSRAILTLNDIIHTIDQLVEWNENINSSADYYLSQSGMQLLAANCTLITAIGEGINRIDRLLPDFLKSNFPEVPWRAIVGMRNHIAHGYFELDADIVFEAVKNDIPPLQEIISKVISILNSNL